MSTATPATEITRLLTAWKDGDRSIENELAARIYPILHKLSRAQVRRNGEALTMAPTELANEAYERLYQQRAVDWQSRDHFFAIASTVIRRVVIDYVRQRTAEKRGSGVKLIRLDDASCDELASETNDDNIDWLALNRALSELGEVDTECAKIVEMRLFSGLTVEQIATVCQSSTATVGRQWRFARAWLSERLASHHER